jgi:selenocysteine-specific translation elongation factor
MSLAQVPARLDKNQPRLPIDRAFSVPGFGTVVTGTLSDGTFRSGEEVEILPGGPRARIRGMQTHKKSVEMGLPGSRLAINLTGVHPDQLLRGMVVTRPGGIRPTMLVDVRLTLVAEPVAQARQAVSASHQKWTSSAAPPKSRLDSVCWMPMRPARLDRLGSTALTGAVRRRETLHHPLPPEHDGGADGR